MLIILLLAIVDFILGTIIGPKSDLEKARGFLGYNSKFLRQNNHQKRIFFVVMMNPVPFTGKRMKLNVLLRDF